MNWNWKKIRFYIKLHWLKALLAIFLTALAISLVFLITVGLRAWNESESYLRQSQLAMIPPAVIPAGNHGLIFGFVYTYLMYWLYFKRGASSFSQTTKKSVAGADVGITWNDVIGMDEAKRRSSGNSQN